jgi:hypothetical protein
VRLGLREIGIQAAVAPPLTPAQHQAALAAAAAEGRDAEAAT